VAVLTKKGRKSGNSVANTDLSRFLSASFRRNFSIILLVDILIPHCATLKRQLLHCQFSFMTKRQASFARAVLLLSNLSALTAENCSLPSTVSKKTKKMIGHHSRLRDMMGQSYPIYACTRANHAHYSSVHVKFCGSSKNTSLK